MTEREFASCIALLCASVGRDMPLEQSKAWFAMLGDLTIDQLKAGIIATVRSYTFAGFPPVGKIRENSGAGTGMIESKDRPTLAWQAVRAAISKVGGYDSPNFADPKIHAAIRAIGGWVFLCDSTSEELVWREKDFLRNYSALEPLKLDADQTARLSGITERENGTALPAPIVNVGCLTVGTSGIKRMEKTETKRITGPHIASAKLVERLTFDDREPDLPTVPPKSKEQQLADLKRLTNERTTITDQAS